MQITWTNKLRSDKGITEWQGTIDGTKFFVVSFVPGYSARLSGYAVHWYADGSLFHADTVPYCEAKSAVAAIRVSKKHLVNKGNDQ